MCPCQSTDYTDYADMEQHRQSVRLHLRVLLPALSFEVFLSNLRNLWKVRSSSIGRDGQLLPNLNLVGVLELVPVGIENPHVLIRVSIKLFADLREIIS